MNLTALQSSYYEKSGEQLKSINILVANAILNVLHEFYLKFSHALVLILCCHKSNTCNFYNNMLQTVFPKLDDLTLQIIVIGSNTKQRVPGRRHHNLLLIDSYKSFLEADIISYTAHYDYNEHYYIFLQSSDKCIPTQLQKILEYCWNHHIIHCTVQVQTEAGEVLVYTYFPFTAQHCRRVVPVLINQFNGSAFVQPHLFPKKLKNFHNCPLRAAVWHGPPFLSLKTKESKTFISGGIEGRLILTVADKLNFTIDVIIPPNDEKRGRVLADNRTTGALHMLVTRQADFSLGGFRQSPLRNSVASFTDNNFQSYRVFALYDPAYYLTSWDILVFPFQLSTWLLFFLSYALCVCRVALVDYVYRRHADIFPQFNSRHAYLHHFGTLMGVTTTNLPMHLRGRVSLINWLLFALVMRTVYQALLYHLIRTHTEKWSPKEHMDLLRLNYTAIMNEGTYEALENLPYIRNFNILNPDSNSDTAAYSKLEEMQSKKYFALGPIDYLLYYAHSNKKVGIFRILPNQFIRFQTTMYMTKHSYLIDELNENIQLIRTVGLIDKWKTIELNYNFFKDHACKTGTVFGMNELYAVFVVGGASLLVAGLIFILELMSIKYSILHSMFRLNGF